MKIEIHTINNTTIAELISEDTIIHTIEDGLDLLGNLYYQGFDKIILYEKNITPDFFDLKSGIAGEILQKFTNYRVRIFIVGDFSKYTSKSLHDFMRESNRGKQVNFTTSINETLNSIAQ